MLESKGPGKFNQLILSTSLSLCLLRNMSVPSNRDLKDYECERGKVMQQPPIPYAQYKYKPWLTEPDKIKIKLLEGDTFQCNLMGDASNSKTYMKWYYNYLRVIVKKKFDEKLLACSETLKGALEDLKKPSKVLKRESAEQKAEHKLELAACEVKSTEAFTEHAKVIGVCYDLIRQLLAYEPQVQRDRITREVHEKDPWMGLDGVKHKGLCMKTSK